MRALPLIGIIRRDPWLAPQVLIPLPGMAQDNSLNGTCLGLDHLIEGLECRCERVETALSLGAIRWEVVPRRTPSGKSIQAIAPCRQGRGWHAPPMVLLRRVRQGGWS